MKTPVESIIFFIIASLLGATGQFLYKSGAVRAGGGFSSYLLNPRLLVGAVCYAGVMVLFIAAFKRGGALSVLYPIYASTFIFSAIGARQIYGETIFPVNYRGDGAAHRRNVPHGMETRMNTHMKTDTYIPERRPLVARGWNASHAAARWLAQRGERRQCHFDWRDSRQSRCRSGAGGDWRGRSFPGVLHVGVPAHPRSRNVQHARRNGRGINRQGLALWRALQRGAGPDFGRGDTRRGGLRLSAEFPNLATSPRWRRCSRPMSACRAVRSAAKADFGGPMSKTHRMFVVVGAALFTGLPADRRQHGSPPPD